MKTLEEIKDEVSKDHGWDKYSQIEQAFRGGVISEHSFNDFLTDVCKDYAQSACEDLRERIREEAMIRHHCGKTKRNNVIHYFQSGDDNLQIDRDLIRNVEIILP